MLLKNCRVLYHGEEDIKDILIEKGKARGILAFTIEVRKGNHSARGLYEKLGFLEEGVRPNFYSLPKEDAVIYWLR